MPTVPGVTHRILQVGELSVHVAEAGEGEPLVLLHGWPQHWYCWHRVVPLLADRYRLVMPDLRGHGWTSAPPTGYDKEQLATDLLDLLDVLELPQVGMIGHDWGGWTGFLACLRAPERFRALLALGIVHPFQRPTLGKALQGWRGAYQVPLSTPLLGQSLMRAGIAGALVRAGARAPVGDVATYSEVMREPARARATVALYRTFLLQDGPRVALGRYADRRLTVPVRLVNGAYDLTSSRALLDGWQPNADDMTVEALDGIGHFVPEEAPEAVAERARALFG
ncbi:MAG: Soluble epoxide hydrolase [Frankiales bacterium]|jgi:pimeloyl-ACP methyl ester carboxylesterase|nr:Soluble epoxide hydrolase [Frankiales bacterium]